MKIIKELPPLFKKSKSKGKILSWKINITQDNLNKIYLETSRGNLDGKKNITYLEIKKGKGKKNILEQAIFNATSKLNNKINKDGYNKDLEKTKTSKKIIKPMLAAKFSYSDLDKKGKGTRITLPCYGQPKLDGLRCLSNYNNSKLTLESRCLKEFNNLDHIKTDLSKVFEYLEYDFIDALEEEIEWWESGWYLDGELFTTELKFEKIAGLCRLKTLKSTLSKKDLERGAQHIKKIKYHIYDCFNINKPLLKFKDRIGILQNVLKCKYDNLVLVETRLLENKNDISQTHKDFIEGKIEYEGLMLRNIDSPYEIDKRSKHLQKLKNFKEEEFTIIGYNEGTGLLKDTVIWICKTKENKEFRVTPKGTIESRKELLKKADNFIGQKLTVCFQELTSDKIPRFPIGKAIRINY